ncbi:MAG: methyltransferase domain-containing protein [Chloroflexi bacterium]|nr:methyltransferase domain-containing protein [Chloroflexota bacterium]
MSAITERYDRDARLYERWWAPVLAPAAAKLLDRCEVTVQDAIRRRGSVRILDIGTGTGALAIDAVHRWPATQIVATDASEGMLQVARRRADEASATASPDTPGAPGAPSTPIRWLAAPADALGLPDASIDLAVSSFVFQLVPDRAAAYREVLRVLRPGGRLCLVTWLAGREVFQAADEFDEAVFDLAIDEEDEGDDPRAGDFRSPTSSIRELRRAGFRSVSAEIDRLDQLWTAVSFLDYKLGYDELALVNDIGPDTAEKLRARASERLAALAPGAFEWRPPIVYLQGKRAGG